MHRRSQKAASPQSRSADPAPHRHPQSGPPHLATRLALTEVAKGHLRLTSTHTLSRTASSALEPTPQREPSSIGKVHLYRWPWAHRLLILVLPVQLPHSECSLYVHLLPEFAPLRLVLGGPPEQAVPFQRRRISPTRPCAWLAKAPTATSMPVPVECSRGETNPTLHRFRCSMEWRGAAT